MSRFATLLRRSSSNLSSPDSSAQQTAFGEVNNECVIELEEIRSLEKSMTDIKALLNDLVKSLKSFHDKGESFNKHQMTWSQSFSKDHEKSVQSSSKSANIAQQYNQQLSEQQNETHNGFVKALEQFSLSISKTTGYETDFTTSVMDGFIKPIQGLLNIIDERKAYRKKYDKATTEYETLIGKVKNAQTSKKIDIIKLYTYERDKTKAKANFEIVRSEYITFLNDTINRMHTDFIDILVKHYESLALQNGNSYQEYAGIKTYIDNLRTWCLSEQDYYQHEVTEREQRRQQELDQEILNKYQPIIQLLIAPPFSLYNHMADVRKNELYPAPVVSSNGQVTTPPPAASPINFLPALVRVLDSYSQISDLLLQLVRADMPNVSVSMGALFANNPIASELVDEITSHLATPYLKHLFDTSITNIINYPDRYKQATPAGIDALIHEFNTVMEIVKNSLIYVPPVFRKSTIEISNTLAQKAAGAAYPPVGCLLFGKVFAPALAKPHTHNLFNVIPSDSALDALQVFSTMFYNLGSNQTFLRGPQNLNDAVAAWKPVVRDFIAQFASTDLTDWESTVQISSTYHNEIPVIQRFLRQHYNAISLAMLQRGERELSTQFLIALGNLEAEDPAAIQPKTTTTTK